MLKFLGFGKDIDLDTKDITKEGTLKKESRIRKIWRE